MKSEIAILMSYYPTNPIITDEILNLLFAGANNYADIAFVIRNDAIKILQSPENAPNNHKIYSQLKALPLYEITNVYAIKEDIEKYQINKNEFPSPFHLIDTTQLPLLLKSFKHILQF